MDLATAIGLAEKGKKLTNPTLQTGAVIHCNPEGELRVLFEATGDGYTFTPKAEHHNEHWQLKEGWGSYV